MLLDIKLHSLLDEILAIGKLVFKMQNSYNMLFSVTVCLFPHDCSTELVLANLELLSVMMMICNLSPSSVDLLFYLV